jgi:Uma2 family endonuclease
MVIAEQKRAERRFVMYGVSWNTYELLLADLANRSSPRVTYDQGRLELMSPSDEHEQYRRLLGRMIDIWTLENRIPIRSFGATTFKREASQRGIEADECYYVRNEALVRGRRGLDLDVDPPPDLAFEIDVSASLLGKLELYAALGVPEVWLFTGETLTMYEFRSDAYQTVEVSLNLPGFPAADIAHWIARAAAEDETEWAASFQDWVRQHGKQAGG